VLADDIVLAATRRASVGPVYRDGKILESHLVDVLCQALREDERVGVPRRECRFALTGWTRPPGGVDLSASFQGGSLLIEAKVGDTWEALWDVIKLVDILVLDPTVTAAYLAYDAPVKTWARTDTRTSLFAAPVQTRLVRDLIEESSADWSSLIATARGIRPEATVGGVRVARIGSFPLSEHAGHELRVLSVAPDTEAGEQVYNEDGWPTA